MKVRWFRLVTAMSMAVLVLAQSPQMTANVPFDFYIGAARFPAGAYTFRSDGVGNSVVRVSDGKGHQAIVMTMASPNRGNPQKPTLLFNEYEGMHFLAEVRWMGAADAQVLPKSALEIQIAQEITAKQVAAATQNR